MEIMDKLKILSAAARYDAACTSSGVDRAGKQGSMGSSSACGICHSFAGDGRCISLLKVLLTNACIFDCQYCLNKRTNDVARATFEARELANLTMQFYRRNYIEGLFLSSAVIRSPDYTAERILEVLRILRSEYHFNGYIHAKAIPGADSKLLSRIGMLADRISVNIELPSQRSLSLLAPDKSKQTILKPMGYITDRIEENRHDIVRYHGAPKFAPAGQSTQMIIGATPDTDYKIISLSEKLYKRYSLKRVFYSAYTPVNESKLLPAITTKPPLWREHRLYQADWLLRFYKFTAGELLDEQNQNLNPFLDPKCQWAINHLEYFPVDVQKASIDELMRVPGIGAVSARKIVIARKSAIINFDGLKKLGVVMKRARFFLENRGSRMAGTKLSPFNLLNALMSKRVMEEYRKNYQIPGQNEELSLFEEKPQLPSGFVREDLAKCLMLQQ